MTNETARYLTLRVGINLELPSSECEKLEKAFEQNDFEKIDKYIQNRRRYLNKRMKDRMEKELDL